MESLNICSVFKHLAKPKSQDTAFFLYPSESHNEALNSDRMLKRYCKVKLSLLYSTILNWLVGICREVSFYWWRNNDMWLLILIDGKYLKCSHLRSKHYTLLKGWIYSYGNHNIYMHFILTNETTICEVKMNKRTNLTKICSTNSSWVTSLPTAVISNVYKITTNCSS